MRTARSATPTGSESGQADSVALLSRFGATIFLAALVIVFALLQPAFLQPLNLFNVMRQISITGIIAVGMTFVILTGGIDLSVGSILALAGLVAAAVVKGQAGLLAGGVSDKGGIAVLWAALAAMAVGLIAGAIQGVATTRMRVPPFVVTLGGMSIFRGMALVFSNGQPISSFSNDFRVWGAGLLGPVPVPVIIFLIIVALAYVVLRYTQYGRWVYAVGGNPEAARLSGLNTTRLVTSVYIISGLLSGLAGFVLAARLNSAEQVAGVGYELTVIASVVIGGTSLFGGEGGVFGTLIGALLIGVLSNGLTLMNVSSYYQQILIGLIIVLAVFFDQLIKQRQR